MSRRPVAHASGPARRAAVLLAALAVGLVAACSAGPSQRPAIAVSQDGAPASTTPSGPLPVPPLDKSDTDGLGWANCTDTTNTRLGASAPTGDTRYDCARLSVTLDSPTRPGRGTTRISLLKVGGGPVPLVVLGDAGGEPGTLYAARLAAQLPADLLSAFTLIGVDRRGTGGSDPMQCVPNRTRSAILGYDPARADLNALLDSAQQASQECVLDLDDRLGAVDSWRAASDLERLRTTLGVAHLNAIARGDGSKVLLTYASRYADHVGRLVLDGAPDPTLEPAGQAEARAASAEQAFAAFATDCAARGCALGGDAAGAFHAVLDQVRDHPGRAPNGMQVTPGIVTNAVLVGLADRSSWPALGDALAAARSGDLGGLVNLVLPLFGDGEQNPPRFDAGLVTGCNDTAVRASQQQLAGQAQDWRAKHPLFGGLVADQLLVCIPWPVQRVQTAKPPTSLPPVLLVSTAADPLTPQAGTERAAQQLPAGVVLGWQGAGHGALGVSQCATAAAQKFLVDGQPPASGTVCPP